MRTYGAIGLSTRGCNACRAVPQATADRGGITTAIWQDWNGGVLGRKTRIRRRSAARWRLSEVKLETRKGRAEGRSRIEYWGVDAICLQVGGTETWR